MMVSLWIDTGNIRSAGRQVGLRVSDLAANVNRQVASRATRAVNAIRNAELQVLSGTGGGRRYRKYPYHSYYTASAPGQPPARRSGSLRMHWNGNVETSGTGGGGMTVTAILEAEEKYAPYLEQGTRNMAARPFIDRIKEKATPEVERIMNEPYT